MMAANINDARMQAVLYDSLQVLFKQVPPSTELTNVVMEDIFAVPNKKAFVLLMSYLLNIIDINKFKSSITNFKSKNTLLYVSSQDLQYRNTISTHIKEISKMYPEARIPFVTPSHMIHGGGQKIVHLILKLSLLCLTIIANKRLGADTVREWCPIRPHPVNDTNQQSEQSQILVLQEKQRLLQEKICKAEEEKVKRQEEIRAKLDTLQKYKTDVHNFIENMPLPEHLHEKLGKSTDLSVLPEIKRYITERRSTLEDNAVRILWKVHQATNTFSYIFPDNSPSAVSLQSFAEQEIKDVFIPLIKTISSSNAHLRDALNNILKTRADLDELTSTNLNIYSSVMKPLLQSEKYSERLFNSSFSNNSVTLSPVHNLNISPLEVAISCPVKFTSEKKTVLYEFPLTYFSSSSVNIRRSKQSAKKSEKKPNVRKENSRPLRCCRLSLPVEKHVCRLSLPVQNYVSIEDNHDFNFPKYDEQLKQSVAEVLNMSLSEDSPNGDSGLGSQIIDSFNSALNIKVSSDFSNRCTSKITSVSCGTAKQDFNVKETVKTDCDEVALNMSAVTKKVFVNSDTPARKPRKSLEALKNRLEAVKRQRIVNFKL